MFSGSRNPKGTHTRVPIMVAAFVVALFVGVSAAYAGVSVTAIAKSTRGDQHAPDVEGTKVVYADNTTGDDDVVLYDAVTKTRKRIADGPDDETGPKISGDHVVYLVKNRYQYVLGLYTISTQENGRLNTGHIGDVYDYAIAGDRVAYVVPSKVESYTYDVMVTSIATGDTKTVDTVRRLAPFELDMAGDYLAYAFDPDFEGNDDSQITDLVVANVSTDATKVVGHGRSPAVTASGTVVYSQFQNDLPTFVRTYESSTDTITTLSTSWARPMDISARRLLLYKTSGLWVYHLDADTWLKIVSAPNNFREQGTARMSGGRVVWDDTRYPLNRTGYVWPAGTPGNWMDYDTYMATYGSPMLSIKAPSRVNYGTWTTIKAKASTTSGTPYTGKMTLQRSYDGTTWTGIATRTTYADGTVTFGSPVIKRTHYFRFKIVKGTTTSYSYSTKVVPVK